jgi:histidinol-phosphate aminotransferase
MHNFSAYFRPELSDLKAYDSGRDNTNTQIWLDANESPWDNEGAEQLNRYPAPSIALQAQLAQFYQVKPDQLLLTRGSDEGVDLLMRLCARPYQDAVMIFPPTFAMYSVYAKIQAAQLIEVPLKAEDNFAFDEDLFDRKLTVNTKLIVFCTPNNPTGNTISREIIIKICNRVKNQALVIVDEAYFEFTEGPTLITDLNEYPNLVVLRTFSKFYGLAGLRCGVLLAAPAIVNACKAILAPFPFNTLTLNALAQTLRGARSVWEQQHAVILNERKIMQTVLSKLSCISKVWDSASNFLLVQCSDAKKVWEHCKSAGIMLRYFPETPLLENCLRISIGLPAENQKLIAVLKEF